MIKESRSSLTLTVKSTKTRSLALTVKSTKTRSLVSQLVTSAYNMSFLWFEAML